MNTKLSNQRFFKIFAVNILTLTTFFISKAETQNSSTLLSKATEIQAQTSTELTKKESPSPWFRKDRWALTVDFGYHFKHVTFKKNIELLSNASDHLEKNFLFKDYISSTTFRNVVDQIAEYECHHPNVSYWGFCKIEIWTHAVNGITENDSILATKIESAYQTISSTNNADSTGNFKTILGI